ncbi:MAG: hypothetical protein J0I14_14570 [Propionibacteriaceae bacterium]|nr:hypothetical protein [Propionibacteriaceae bacterium]
MLKRFATLWIALLISCGGAIMTGSPAMADDDADPQLSAGNGEVTGALTIQHPGDHRGLANPEPDAPESPLPKPPPTRLPDSGCRTDAGESSVLRCAVDEPGDLTAIREFTPPTEAEVRVALRLPDPTPRFGPDPSVNEWKMLAVGYPIWLWTDKPTTLEATATHDGLTMTLTAERTSTSFDLGDGHHLTCTRTTEYPARPDRYGTPSPTCGYTYQKRSRPGHDYTVTATTHWQITWTTAGRTGTLTTTHTGHRTLPIGELQALIRG